MSIIFQKSCPWFQNQPTEIRGRIAALSPNSPFLGSVSTPFSLFLLSGQLFVYFSPTFFFLEKFFAPIQKWILDFKLKWIPDSTSMWIPDSSPLDSGIQHQKFAGFRIPDSVT